jgi:hypothetical protein
MAKLVKVPQIGPARQARRFRSGPNVFCKQGIQFSCVAGGFDAWNFQVNRCSRGGCPEPSPYPSEGRRFDMGAQIGIVLRSGSPGSITTAIGCS